VDTLQNPKQQRLLTILFCGFLAAMTVLYLCLPKSEFSLREKRYLAQTPELTRDNLASGDFSADVDAFMADHIPGRSFFVGLNAYYELFTGRQGSKDILLTRDQRLVEAPVEADDAVIDKNMAILNGFAEKQSVPVDLMVVPSAGWAAEDRIIGIHDAYPDEAILRSISAKAGENLRTVDVLTPFAAGSPEHLYYRTDHHWTSAGAHTAYRVYLEHLGREPRPEADYRMETIPGFLGSTYSRSALWLTPAEPLELWTGGEHIQVIHEGSDTPHPGVFFRERLEESDKYTVYLDGNHALVRLTNPEAAGSGSLLVIRDSFSNCLGGFLADSFETVILADLRYYRQPLSELIESEKFDHILICYSIGNFMTDTNMIWLR